MLDFHPLRFPCYKIFGIGEKVINVYHILLKNVSVVIVEITDASKPTDFLLSLESIGKCI